MALAGLLKALFNAFCGPPSTKPESVPPQQESKPPYTQPIEVRPSQQQQHPVSPPRPPPSHRPHHRIENQDQQNEHYTSLRAQANVEGDQMAQSFQQSHEAYARRDGALAKQLSDKGKEHKRKMESLNKQASDWIFTENNTHCEQGEIDLHGLYVKEAIARTDAAIQQAKQLGHSQIRLIVGKGLHSQGGAAKIKPAIEELMRKEQLVAELDPNNAGVLIVYINSKREGGARPGPAVLGPEEITRNLDKDDGRCIIM